MNSYCVASQAFQPPVVLQPAAPTACGVIPFTRTVAIREYHCRQSCHRCSPLHQTAYKSRYSRSPIRVMAYLLTWLFLCLTFSLLLVTASGSDAVFVKEHTSSVILRDTGCLWSYSMFSFLSVHRRGAPWNMALCVVQIIFPQSILNSPEIRISSSRIAWLFPSTPRIR